MSSLEVNGLVIPVTSLNTDTGTVPAPSSGGVGGGTNSDFQPDKRAGEARTVVEYASTLVEVQVEVEGETEVLVGSDLDYDFIDATVSILNDDMDLLLGVIGAKVTIADRLDKVRGVMTDESQFLQLTAYPWVLKLDLNTSSCTFTRESLLVELQQRGYVMFANSNPCVLSSAVVQIHPGELCEVVRNITGATTLRLIGYGMKTPVRFIPEKLELALQRAVQNPRIQPRNFNQFDISCSAKSNCMFGLKVPRNREGFEVDYFPLWNVLDSTPGPGRELGGNFTVRNFNFNEGEFKGVLQVKMYNIIYHVMKTTSSHSDLQAPVRNVGNFNRRLQLMLKLMRTFQQHPDLICGLRIEVRIQARTLGEAVTIFRNLKLNNPFVTFNMMGIGPTHPLHKG